MSFRKIEVKIIGSQDTTAYDDSDLKEICAKAALNTITNIKNIDPNDYGFKTFYALYEYIIDNPDATKLTPVDCSEHCEPFNISVDAEFYKYVDRWSERYIDRLLEQAYEISLNTLREIGA